MRISSIVKVVTLSLFTTKASVRARPVQKDAVEVNDSYSANKVQLDAVAEAERLSSVSFPSSGEELELELFPKGLKEVDSIFLRFFRRKRQISCGSECTT